MNKKGEKHSSKNLRKKINIELKATPKFLQIRINKREEQT